MVLVRNPSLRLQDLTYDQLRELVIGTNRYWGFITKQNRNAALFAYGEPSFLRDAAAFILGEGASFGEEGPRVQLAANEEQLRQRISEHPGALAIVPAVVAQQWRGARTVGLRHTSLVVHPEVVELQAGRRLEELTVRQIRDLVGGSASSWRDVGGPSIEIEAADFAADDPGVYEPLPAVPVLWDGDAGLQSRYTGRVLEDLAVRENAVTVGSVDRFVATLTETPGAFGLIRRREALAHSLPTVEVRRVTHSVNLRPSFFVAAPSQAGAVGGVSYIIVNTIAMVLLVLIVATPIGVSAAVYLVEYAKQGPLVRILRLGTDTLAGVPSIIFGLFGMVFFSQFLGLKTGLLSGTLTLTLMILPTVVRTSEEALRSVPFELREGSLAIGATQLQTIIRVVLPTASPGILTGIILGIGRAVGETAALLFTMGSNLALVRSLRSPVRVLSVHLYMLIRESISLPNAFAAATILVIIVFIVNITTTRLIRRFAGVTGRSIG
jgi:phosphate transport system permease protein